MAKYFTKQILLFIALLSFILAFSCSKKTEIFYLLSTNSEVRKLEMHDHEICTRLKLNIDDQNILNSKYYWQCRLAFARYRISSTPQNPILQNIRSSNFIDLAAKINLKISQTNESFLSIENRKIDNHQHNQCLSLGFIFETDNQAKIDEYFFCRRALLEELQDIAPFGRQELLKYQNDKYNLPFIVNRRLEENLAKEKALADEFPTCMKFNIYSENFKRCKNAENNSRTCFNEINAKIFRKEWERKIKCQKQAYTKYSDDLLKVTDDSLIFENKQRNQNSDFINNNNLAALGASETDFISKEKLEEIKKEKQEKGKTNKASKINSKLGLYNKYELSKLRQKYIYACQLSSNDEIEKFGHQLENQCEKLKEFEILGQ